MSDDASRPPAIPLASLDLKRGRGRLPSVTAVYDRDLTSEDIEAKNIAPKEPPRAMVARLGRRHQMAARMVATGASNAIVSAGTGYDAGYVSVLRDDPAFKELVAQYAGEREAIHKWFGLHEAATEAEMRLVNLAMSAADEMQSRIEGGENVGEVTTGLLLKIMCESFDRSVAPAKKVSDAANVAVATSAPNININFGEVPKGEGANGPTIDVTPSKEDVK